MAAAATYVMAAAESTFLACLFSSPYRNPSDSRSCNALAEALNSTGNVTSWKSTARLNIRIPISISILVEPNISPSTISIHDTCEPTLANGKSAVLKLKGPYP